MRFLVTGTAIDGVSVPPAVALGAYRATFEILAAGKDSRIQQAFPHADERATTLLVEVDSADDLADVLGHLPGFMLSSWKAHPIASVERTLQGVVELESAFAGQGA